MSSSPTVSYNSVEEVVPSEGKTVCNAFPPTHAHLDNAHFSIAGIPQWDNVWIYWGMRPKAKACFTREP